MNEVVPIQNKIYEIRGQRVMLDRDLAELYGVTTGALNQAVKRNSERFPTDFMFRLTDTETENWKSQIVITNSITKGLRRNPYAFTEQGVSMLSAVLKSPTAVQTSIAIMRALKDLGDLKRPLIFTKNSFGNQRIGIVISTVRTE